VWGSSPLLYCCRSMVSIGCFLTHFPNICVYMCTQRQYEIIGRPRPTPKNKNPIIYRMKIFAPNKVVARSRFWYFLSKRHKTKKTHTHKHPQQHTQTSLHTCRNNNTLGITYTRAQTHTHIYTIVCVCSGPTTVLVLSLLFIGFVIFLHVWGKLRRS